MASRATDLQVDKLVADPAIDAVTPQGTPGSTTYGYKIVGVTANGNKTAASAEDTTGTGAATLNGTDFNRITWTDVAGAESYEVYRTTGGATQGLIGTVASGVEQFDDTGLEGDSATPPATNGTGTGAAQEVHAHGRRSVQVSGTYVGELVVEGALDRDADWEAVTPVLVSQGGIYQLPETLEVVRVRMPAYTSGDPAVRYQGAVR